MKQIIIVNEALMLPRGKLAAQVAHASLASFLSASEEERNAWLKIGMPKVVLSAGGLPTEIIKDAGKTVVKAGTITCVGIGPSNNEDIDKITSHLRLLK